MTRTDWSFWQLNRDTEWPQPDRWVGPFAEGTPGEVYHSGGGNWNRAWINIEARVGILTSLVHGTHIWPIAYRLENDADDGEEPQWYIGGKRLEQATPDFEDLTAEEGTPEYYYQLDAALNEAVKELIATYDESYDAD
jgi:hypothetical protein